MNKDNWIENNYDRLCDIVSGFGAEYLRFSMFKTIDYGDSNDLKTWTLKCPDIESDKPAFNGKCVFNRYYGYPNILLLPEMENPTWKDIILALDITCKDIDHVFLESIEFKETKNGINYYFCHFGS